MAIAQTDEPTLRKPLRLWPGVVIAVLLLLVSVGLPIVVPDTRIFGLLGGLVGGLVVGLWWVFFSRAAWSERLGAIVLTIVALFGTSRVVHASIATGMMGMLFFMYAIPVLGLALVAWAVATRSLADGLRRASMVATILLACGVFTLLRTSGVAGNGGSDFAWRWTQSPEERLLSQAKIERVAVPTAPAAAETSKKPLVPQADKERAAQQSAVHTGVEPATLPSTPAAPKQEADWPGFRGPDRDGIVRGVQIETDWSRFPPVQLWRRPIGPGWSSLAVSGDLLFTQEQRGDDEIVACYKVTTGEPVWRHRDAVRFWESNGGAGPRATPTLSNGRVYTFGATGILNALDENDGAVVWSRNVASDSDTKVPIWGFVSSPLVVNDVVIVAASGKLVGYEIATGKPRWIGPVRGDSYSSPHRVTIDGVAQVLLLSAPGATSVAPEGGTVLWEHAWPGVTIVQPAQIEDGALLISTATASGGIGMRRIAVAHGTSGWTADERWTSAGLKPYFNDLVIHKGHAFGFDGSILACIDLSDGKRTWKGGRYGYGQLLLLPDQDVLLVLSEEGELALVGATPDQFTELARFPGLEGKTWNHPVMVGDVLLVRNGQEMAAFRLPHASR
jgi:outer membrane protein assembly factor BamB